MGNEQVIREYRDKRILIWGAGMEGLSTYRFFRRNFPEKPLTIADRQEVAIDDPHVEFVRADGWLPEFRRFDAIFKSPGIPILDEAIDKSLLTSQTELFAAHYRDNMIGITGTKGKSTTSSLLYHVLRHGGRDALLLGNIGVPCLDRFDDVAADTAVVFELSCHQLETLRYSPHIGALLNLYEDHFDHYGGLTRYQQAKENIFRHQRQGDLLIAGRDIAFLREPPAEVIRAALEGDAQIAVVERGIRLPDGQVLEVDLEETCLRGRHNLYNIGVAYYIASRRFGIPDDAFREALASYRGLPHRMQRLGVFDGVEYYNDSISTICASAIQAMEALGRVDTVIIGGMDRGIHYEPLADYLAGSPVRNILLLPDTHTRLLELFRSREVTGKAIVPVPDMAFAVRVAGEVTAKGKICLLSPAAASYNRYKNFEARGLDFQRQVELQHARTND